MMSFKDFKKSKEKQTTTTKDKKSTMIYNKNSNDKVAGPLNQQSNKPIHDQNGTTFLDKTKESNDKQQSLSSSASTSSVTSTKSTSSSSQKNLQVKMSKLFTFIGETYRNIRRCTSGLQKDLYNTHLIDTINKYKIGCNKIYENALESYEMSFKLAQNIIRTLDLFKDMCTTYTNMEEYQHRICELMAIFITCELRLSVDTTTQEQVQIGNRIVYIMRKHLVQEDEEETRYNILRTLVYIPRLFNAREVMCVIFGEFIPLKPVLEINVLTDKLYMLYIIVFYRWMKMQKDSDDMQIIVNFAESFMKPSVTLCGNKLYATHLPRYTTHSSATKTILNNMAFYKDIRNASIIDNALKKMGTIVNLCDDDEDDDVIIEDTCSCIDFADIFATVQLEPLDAPLSNIKLEEKTVVDSVDLTLEEEGEYIISCETNIRERHEKWLNSFQLLAQQFRESQVLLKKQQSLQITETQKVICLDSDSEGEADEEVTNAKEKEIANNNKPTATSEDLFMDNYPLTTTPINCESDLESSDAEDADDVTKLSSRFLPRTLRTYQAKSREKDASMESELGAEPTESNLRTNESADSSIDIAYRRDSIHISSTPPGRVGNEDDEGTDVQDEHEDDNDDINNKEGQYTFLPKLTSKKTQKEMFVKTIKPMGPYPTYNNMNAEKIIFSQAIPHNRQHKLLQQQNKQYFSDSSEAPIKKSEQQKKRVHFNTSPMGPTSAYSSGQKYKLKPSLLQQKQQQQQQQQQQPQNNYKAADAPDYFHLGGFDRFSCAPSITDSLSTVASTSTSSSLKQQQQHQEQTGKIKRKLEIEQSSNVNTIKRSNFNKNLSVFNPKYLNIKNQDKQKYKYTRNVKIRLRKYKKFNDISLTNCNSIHLSKEQKPHTHSINVSSNKIIKQTELCPSITINSSNTNTNVSDDDAIFKKPLPVKRFIRIKSSFLKIQNVVSLNNEATSFKNNESNKVKETSQIDPLAITEQFEFSNEPNLLKCTINEAQKANNEVNMHTEDIQMDALSVISKMLTEEINTLTSQDDEMISHNVVLPNLDTNPKEDFEQPAKEQTILKEQEITESLENILNNQAKEVAENNFLAENQMISKDVEAIENIPQETNDIVPSFEPQNSPMEMDTKKNCHVEASNLTVVDKLQELISVTKNATEKMDESIEFHEKENETKSNAVELEKEPLNIDGNDTTDFSKVPPNVPDDKLDSKVNNAQEYADLNQNEQISLDKIKEEEMPSDKSQEDIIASNDESLEQNIPISDKDEINSWEKISTRTEKPKIMENSNNMEVDEEADTKMEALNVQNSQLNDDGEDKNVRIKKDIAQIAKDDDESSVLRQVIIDVIEESQTEPNNKLQVINEQSEVNTSNTVNPKSNFSAEFLAGLPNDTSTTKRNGNELTDIIKNNYEMSKDDIDFEFESNSSTTAMCRIDLEAMSENTSDVPAGLPLTIMPSKDCEADKLLEEFNHKTEDIVGSSLNNNVTALEAMLLRNKKRIITSPKLATTNGNIETEYKEKSKEITKIIHKNKTTHEINKDEMKPQNPAVTTEDSKKLEKEQKTIKPSNNEKLPNIETVQETIMTTKTNDKNLEKISPSIDKSQHMTLELGNWKNDANESKSSDTEGGVSAIFSFPKIPIISISIHTTPNNKTYFKISNRENDNETNEVNNKKLTQKDKLKEAETTKIFTSVDKNYDNEETTFESSINDQSTQPANDCLDKETVQEEPLLDDIENDEEVEGDALEFEKCCHDSNSASSLPLKKRPTQSDHPNDDTEDSQHNEVANLEHTQEIAAEVVIDHTHKDIPELEENTELISSHEEFRHGDDEEALRASNDVDDNKPSTSAACFKKTVDPATPFIRRVHLPVRPIGHTPVQVVAPQLKDKLPSSSQDHRSVEPQTANTPRLQTNQPTQPLPESYPATPMLSVANVEKLMDFNRFIEDLLASPDVMTIIDNANACGYYAEGQAYEMERIAILEHYNIANAKGTTTVTKPLYWRKSSGDTISIFNDNDNEWISLPPSTSKQLLKLSFVLSILQQQYKVSDIRQRINIALTFLIKTSFTSKIKPTSTNTTLQQRMQQYSRTISEATNSNHHTNTQPLPSTSYFRIATNNDSLNTNFCINTNMETVQDMHAQSRQQQETSLQQEISGGATNPNNTIIQYEQPLTINSQHQQQTDMYHNAGNNIETENLMTENHHQQQQQQQQDKRISSWEEFTNDQLYINPPCATSPQNEVIVNTNGVQLHEMPQNFQDQQNILISITDETASSAAEPIHKYNTRQQQHRPLEDIYTGSTASGPYAKRPCLANNNSLLQNHFAGTSNGNLTRNIVTTFGNQEINLQNPYRLQQQQQQLQQQQQHTNKNYTQRIAAPSNMQQNLPINIYNSSRSFTSISPQLSSHHRMTTRYGGGSVLNSQNQSTTPSQTKQNESNYKDILQPYITYLIRDHEKTSKHLLQVFKEVSNSSTLQQDTNDTSNTAVNMLLPPLIRNPQQNHMPPLRDSTVLPALLRNPHQNLMIPNLPVRDSGALQVVQSFLEQTQQTYENTQHQLEEQQQRMLTHQIGIDDKQQKQQQYTNVMNPGFVKEYVNFVGSRDEVLQKPKLRNYNTQHQQQQQQHQQLTDLQHQQRQQQQKKESQKLNCAKRKCQERNDKLAEDLKQKMVEFSLLKHNVQFKLFEKDYQTKTSTTTTTNQLTTETNSLNSINIRRGRSKKSENHTNMGKVNETSHSQSCEQPPNKIKRTRATRGTTAYTALPDNAASSNRDHAYYRQRSTGRGTRKRTKHIAAAATLFRNIFDRPRYDKMPYSYPAPFSPSSSSVSSRSLTSPNMDKRKPRYFKNSKSSLKLRRSTICSRDIFDNEQTSGDERHSLIRNREAFHCLGPPGVPCTSFQEGKSIVDSSDDFDDVSDSNVIKRGRFRKDDKLMKRCAVVITPTKEILQYERKRDELYNEILQKQRKTLELRAIEKQREKDKRRFEREGKRDHIKWKDSGARPKGSAMERDKQLREYRNYNDLFLSSESDIETHSQFRTRKQKQKLHQQQQLQTQKQLVKELQPLNVQTEMTEATNSLLNEIDAHLDKPVSTGECKNIAVEEENVKRQCEITERSNKSTKMRELNLLADTAHHLSPYQLELQSNLEIQNSPPTTDLINFTQATLENEKAKVTEQRIIQSFNNLLEKQLEVNNKTTTTTIQSEQERRNHVEDVSQTAAAKLSTSPGSLLETERTEHQKYNNTPNEICENSREEALEQILEESISVLKSVTSPSAADCNLNNSVDTPTTKPKPKTESIIPLLISSVESLSHMELNINEKKSMPESSSGSIHLKKTERSPNDTNCLRNKTNVAKELENYDMESNKASSKDMACHLNSNAAIMLSSSLMKSSLHAADLADISCEHGLSSNFRPSSLMPADISDISLESEISKHLPDIAEPSPVVTTDMSDNSMGSEMSKSFTETTENSAIDVDMVDLSLPVLPLVLPSITSTPVEVESNFNINTTLHTPTKIQLVSIMDSIALQSSDSLNTPIKAGTVPELETSVKNGLAAVLETPVKNGIEQEADTNVTKFLDLILNKTVTDAESETRDKILKELNAITVDTLAVTSLEGTEIDDAADKEDKRSNDSCAEVISGINTVLDTETITADNEHLCAEVASEINNSIENVPEIIDNKSVDSSVTAIENKALKSNLKSLDSPNKLLDFENKSFASIGNESLANAANSEETNKSLDSSDFLTTGNMHLDSTATVISNNSLNSFLPNQDKSLGKLMATSTATSVRTSAIPFQHNAEVCDILSDSKKNALKISLQEPCCTQLTPPTAPINGGDSEEQSPCNNSTSVTFKLKSPIKQTFNIKCRVRLKRLNIAQHFKANEIKTFTKPEEVTSAVNNEEISNCDNENETTASLVKIPCSKINNINKHTEEAAEENKTAEADEDKLLEYVIKEAKLDATPEPTIIEKPILVNTLPTTKTKSKSMKSVTFDLSNIPDDLRYSTSPKLKQKSKGFYMKTHRHPRKLPENTLRAAETLQIFVNTINDSTQTPPPAEFNKKRNPIKNKCIAEDETPRPPIAAALIGVAHKKTDKSRSSNISTSKCKDQLVSSLATASIPSITSDLSTARIYTSSPLDQTLPEYDDNVDSVADSELILPTATAMSNLRRKSKKPKKSLTRPEPVYDTSTDDIIDQPPECNGDEDTDAVVDNEVDVFAEELLPIPAANPHILEEIVSAARTPHIGTGTAIRDDYMNIEATATVPVYLFNDESRDLSTPEPIQTTCETNVVDSSSFLRSSPSATCNTANHMTAEASTTTGNLEKSMLSPSEHEVSSTQETFFQTPIKNKINGDASGDKVLASNKDKTNPLAAIQKPQDDTKTKEDKTSSACLLQNNQVDTTNHSPEMCTLTLTTSSSSSSSSSPNRKIRKASTHDEILFNELQQQQHQQHQQQKPLQQQQQHKRMTATTTFSAESTSDNKKIKIMSDDTKTNGSFGKTDDKNSKAVEDSKTDKLESSVGGGGGSSPSTTTTINEETISRAKRKKTKSSKSEKCKYNEKQKHKSLSTSSSYSPHITANPLIITIPKSRILRPPPTPTPTVTSEQPTEPTTKIQANNNGIDKDKREKHHHHNHHSLKRDKHTVKKSKSANSLANIVENVLVIDDMKQSVNLEHEAPNATCKSEGKEKTAALIASLPSITFSSLTVSTKKKDRCNGGGTSNSKFTNDTNSIFFKDKYDLIKNKEKYQEVLGIKEKQPEYLSKAKEKGLDLLKTKEKNNNHTKLSSKRTHKSVYSKDKTKEKEEISTKVAENPINPANVLKSITHSSCNKTITPTSNNTITANSSSLASAYSSLSPVIIKPTNSKLTKTSSDTNSSNSSCHTKLKSLSTMQTSATAAPSQDTSSSMPTISTSHVRKKLKTK